MKSLKTASNKVSFGNSNGYSYGNGRVGSVFSNGNAADEPEADPVSHADAVICTVWLTLLWQNVLDWDRHTIVGTSQEIFKEYLRLTSVSGSSFLPPCDLKTPLTRNPNLRRYDHTLCSKLPLENSRSVGEKRHRIPGSAASSRACDKISQCVMRLYHLRTCSS